MTVYVVYHIKTILLIGPIEVLKPLSPDGTQLPLQLLIGPIEVLKRWQFVGGKNKSELLIGPIEVLKLRSLFSVKYGFKTFNRTY